MCLQPIYKNYIIKNYKYEIDWKSSGLVHDPSEKAIGLPCGNCPECWQKASNEWATRCYLESKHYSRNCVITLTYDDEHCDNELHKRDYQLFLKRLRKQLTQKIKYFVSGEYGDLKGRPHYHMIIFGFCPEDLVFLKKTKRGTALYNSKFLESLWPHGFVVVDPNITREACFYSAKYLQKLVSQKGVQHKQPPFVQMSKGIAQKEADEFDPFDDQNVYINGRRYKAPRYFFKRFRKRKGDVQYFEYLKYRSWFLPKVDICNPPLALLRGRSQVRSNYEAKIASNENKIKIFYKRLHILC